MAPLGQVSLVPQASSVALLANNASFTSGDIAVAPTFKRICGVIASDQAGTLSINYKLVGTSTYQTVQSVAVTANTPAVFDYPMPFATCQVVFQNTGGSTQTKMSLEVFTGAGL